eukprot:CAMPEP_0176409902 /NCGR_PEP_ID=MMETSP0127-20121128/2760_1 /TAXON_ID=938130 /ORGANISM="Platyophrya macrostoma, Strain WH" /LENGTH=206 /DNA_ID=CAMNT_0017789341 /DNA_START=211 /DNA_END=831 /DNA_ORIENTATION=-
MTPITKRGAPAAATVSTVCPLEPCTIAVAPTTGQELFHMELSTNFDATRTAHHSGITIRELGGRMAPSWGKMMSKRESSVKGIIYMVDITQAWQLPVSIVEFATLLAVTSPSLTHSVHLNDDETREPLQPPPVLLLLNKAAHLTHEPFTTQEDIRHMYLASIPESQQRRIQITVVDTWLGIGLGDVCTWLTHCATQKHATQPTTPQ